MEQVFLLYHAEKLKYRHSLSGKLWILFPCLTLLMAYGLAANYGTVDSYNWWYIGILPGFLTLYCCMSQEKEKKIRNQAVLLTAEDLKKAWDAKTLNAVKYVAAANVLLVSCSFLLGNIVMPLLQQEQVIYVSAGQNVLAALVMILASLWQIPLCLWMDRKIGMFPTLAVNMALNTSGCLTAVTGLWMLNPWGILPRIMCPVIGILPNGLTAHPGNTGYIPGITDPASLFIGSFICLALFVILWAATRVWYDRKGAEAL